MSCLDPVRMADLIWCHSVRHIEERNCSWIFKTRQVQIPKEHDVGIQDAVSLVRQRGGRSDLEKLLHMPTADRPCSKRPPILTPLALDDARQRSQPFGQELRGRKNASALALKTRE